MEITTIGLDLAKSVYQVHGVDAAGNVVVRKALRRAQVLPFFGSAQAGAGRDRRRRQPNGARRVVDHGARGHLPCAYQRCGMTV